MKIFVSVASVRLFRVTGIVWISLLLLGFVDGMSSAAAAKHAVPREHPRLLGSQEHLQSLARKRQEAYKRVESVARGRGGDDHSKMISMALVCAIEQDEMLGRSAVQMAMKYINGPIRKGHVTFAHDLARCAIVYDLCHEYWTEAQRESFHEYVNRTVDANVRSETHVFHNGWYGYKNGKSVVVIKPMFARRARFARSRSVIGSCW